MQRRTEKQIARKREEKDVECERQKKRSGQGTAVEPNRTGQRTAALHRFTIKVVALLCSGLLCCCGMRMLFCSALLLSLLCALVFTQR